MWIRRAVDESPSRENLVELAQVCHDLGRWFESLHAIERALAITERPASYLSEPWAWGVLPYDLGSLAAWNVGDKPRAAELGRIAVTMAPEDERLAANLKWFEGSHDE